MKRFIPAQQLELPKSVVSFRESFDPYETLREKPRSQILHDIFDDYFMVLDGKIRPDVHARLPHARHIMYSDKRRALNYLGFPYESVARVDGNRAFNNIMMRPEDYSQIKKIYLDGMENQKTGDEIIRSMVDRFGYRLSFPSVLKMVKELGVHGVTSDWLLSYAQPQYIIPNLPSIAAKSFTLSKLMDRLAMSVLDFGNLNYGSKPILDTQHLLESGVINEGLLVGFEQRQREILPETDRIDRAHKLVFGLEKYITLTTGLNYDLDGPFTPNPDISKLVAAYTPPSGYVLDGMSLTEFAQRTGFPEQPAHFSV